MWRTMYECHQAQTFISQQLNHLSDNQSSIVNSEYHHHATRQLETEVTYWYKSFCKLVKSQREYVRILDKWIRRTECLMDGRERSGSTKVIQTITEHWGLGLDKLPDKVLQFLLQNFFSTFYCCYFCTDVSEVNRIYTFKRSFSLSPFHIFLQQ